MRPRCAARPPGASKTRPRRPRPALQPWVVRAWGSRPCRHEAKVPVESTHMAHADETPPSMRASAGENAGCQRCIWSQAETPPLRMTSLDERQSRSGGCGTSARGAMEDAKLEAYHDKIAASAPRGGRGGLGALGELRGASSGVATAGKTGLYAHFVLAGELRRAVADTFGTRLRCTQWLSQWGACGADRGGGAMWARRPSNSMQLEPFAAPARQDGACSAVRPAVL